MQFSFVGVREVKADLSLKTPLQDNGCDCGIFLCAKMLSILYGLPDFLQKDMTNVRRHIALQLHRGTVYVPKYNIPKLKQLTVVESSAVCSPSAPLTQEDLDAFQLLLGLATPEPVVHFDHNVQVQEFWRTVRSASITSLD
jgi:hypothetical protein